MAGLHDLAATPATNFDDQLNFACECGSLTWREPRRGRFWEDRILRLTENGGWAGEDFENLDQDTDETEPWTCDRCGTRAREALQDYLNDQ